MTSNFFSDIGNMIKDFGTRAINFITNFGSSETPTSTPPTPLAYGWNVGTPAAEVPYIGLDTFNGTLNTIVPNPDIASMPALESSEIPFPPYIPENATIRQVPILQSKSTASVGEGSVLLPQNQEVSFPEAKYDNSKCPKLKLKLDSNLYGPKFLNRVKEIAKKVNCDYKDLMAVMFSESGLKANARPKKGSAIGLIQFLTDSAISVGTTVEALAEMTPMEQLKYVEKLLLKTKRYRFSKDAKLTGPDLYAIIFLPAFADRDVLTVKGEKYYNWNPKADRDQDGKITKDDLWTRLQECYVDDSSFV